MGKPKTSDRDIAEIIRLRKSGLSLDSIHKIVSQGKTTIYNYIKDVKVNFDLRGTGSRNRSMDQWKKARNDAKGLLGTFSKKSRFLILATLYWGEGTKRELNLINSDSKLIKVFLHCLKDLGVKNEDLKISLRLYEDIDQKKAKDFWAKITRVNVNRISGIETIRGKKQGRLKYGMCRVRIRKGARYFKIIMSMIDLIKSKL